LNHAAIARRVPDQFVARLRLRLEFDAEQLAVVGRGERGRR
jgi:hypothetical protein